MPRDYSKPYKDVGATSAAPPEGQCERHGIRGCIVCADFSAREDFARKLQLQREKESV